MQVQDDVTRIEQKIQNGYTISIESCISGGWNLFRKNPGPFILYGLLAGVILFFLGLIPIAGAIASYLVGPALYAGVYLGARKIDTEGSAELNDFFKGFDHVVQLFLYSLISGILISIATVLLIIPGIWLAVAVTLAMPMIVFAKTDFWESIKMSVKLVNKNWFQFFALWIIIILLNFVGVIFLFVGLLVTIPVTFCILYVAYKEVVGFSSGEGQINIEDHLVDDSN
ncbi:MAG: hypothetical protein AAGC47_03470 [Bacteroidota bacterium]